MGLWDPYDVMGEHYQTHAADGAYNAHYDRPAMLSCVGEVAGREVLDAACGPGFYTEELLARGASVEAFDGSAEMATLARRRVGNSVDVRVASLDDPLPYDDDSFDLVLCALAIHYAADRAATFREFHRVLRAGGRVVLSTQHPTVDWLRKGGSYFDVALETDRWDHIGGAQDVRFWREPLGALCAAATDAGFLIRGVHEPLPAESMRQSWPDEYETLRQRPGFLILDLLKL
ncbi:class I SAM-dependent methyltransferase [Planctomonas psychrotolerans]|uniref:class I SAM-dependent methyltransferase n=1 Tax=Planctomonas psychrotolerans TaxID=2528712 RepID=UPI00123993D7|nr:class I SAM-dependent methyltransferase [Planctomonas psychrotolerans]